MTGNVVWHDTRGNVISLADQKERDAIECQIMSLTNKLKLTSEHVLTSDLRQALTDDVRAVIEAVERYGSCGD